MSELNPKACCFTGHRPQKLQYGYDEEAPACVQLKEDLLQEINAKITGGVTSFFTGMAMGADIWCAEIVLACGRMHPDAPVTLTAVIPYENQPSAFPLPYQKRYAQILKETDSIIYIAEKYEPGCMHRRNQYMVDHAGCVIAVSSGAAGGTRDTIRMAKKRGLDIVIFDPDTLVRTNIPSQLRFEQP